MAADHSDTFGHVRDYPYFELPFGHEYRLPEIYGFQLTRFMVLQVVAGLLVLFVFCGLAWHIRKGRPARGRFWGFWEMLALYIRDQVVRPTIGDPNHHHHDAEHGRHADFVEGGDNIHVAHDPADEAAFSHGHPADKYLPFIWTCFFYVLFCNLLGALPWLGTPTGDINVTGALALCAFGMTVISGTRQLGFKGFLANLAPGMDLPGPMKFIVLPLVWVIEAAGLLIKHIVLAVRLFANMMGGHTVVAVILGFIAMVEGWVYWLVLPSSIFAQVGICLLELLFSFIQAYIFAFLATIFIATVIHKH